MSEEKEKVFLIDLQKVSVEKDIDEFTEMDLSKVIGNTVHQRAGDIGLDDKARELYHNGQVELTQSMANQFKGIIASCDLVFFVRKAVIEHIDKSLV